MSPTNEARRAFDLILQSEQARRDGWEARSRAIMELAEAGLNHREISERLVAEAVQHGLTPEQIELLGVSKENVRLIIREHRQVQTALQRQTRTES